MKISKETTSYVLYILLVVVVLLIGYSDVSETNSSLTEWVEQPITEMTIRELIYVLIFIVLMTPKQCSY